MRWLVIFVLCISLTKAHAIELSINVDSVGNSVSCITGSFHGSIYVLQFKWNRWVSVDTLGLNIQWKDTCISKKLFLHSGENQFRISAVYTNPYVGSCLSYVTKTAGSGIDCGCNFGEVCGPSGRIKLKCESRWEIHDQNDVFLKSGTSILVPVSDLPKGGYYLYFDNCHSEFFKQ